MIKSNEFIIISSENGITDVEYKCPLDSDKTASITWCEDNCDKYYSCQRIADANRFLVDNENVEITTLQY